MIEAQSALRGSMIVGRSGTAEVESGSAPSATRLITEDMLRPISTRSAGSRAR